MINQNNTSSPRQTWLFLLQWPLYRVGGVNQVVTNLARQMQQSEHFRPLVLINDWTAKTPVFETSEGIEIVRWRLHPYDTNMSIKARLHYTLWAFRFKKEFSHFCKVHNVGVINPHFPNGTALAIGRLLTKMKSTISLVTSFHGSELSRIGKSPEGILAQWRTYLKQNSSIVACSSDLAHKITATFGTAISSLIRIVHNGVDAPKLLAMAGDRQLSDRKIILSVGKFEHQKGQDVLLRAFSLFAERHPDVDLLMAGGAGDKLPQFKELCIQTRIEDRVTFLTDVPHADVLKLYQKATLFCLPSRSEAFGIVLLEAGLFNLPVVSSRIGGTPEIITDSVTGVFVEPDAPEALALALESMLNNPAQASAMASALHERVVSHFTWENACSQYTDLLHQDKVNAA